MKNYIIVFLTFFIYSSSSGQIQYSQGVLNVNTNPAGIAEEIRPNQYEDSQEVYLNSEWQEAVLIMNNDYRHKLDSMKFNLLRQQIEFFSKGLIQVIDNINIKAIKLFVADDQYKLFVSNEEFKNSENLNYGYYEVLNKGVYQILKFYNVIEIPGNYNPALDVGSRNDQYRQETEFYLTRNKRLYKLPKRRKNFDDISHLDNEDVLKFIKNNRIKPADENDLLRLADFLNNHYISK